MAQRNKVQHHGTLGESTDGKKIYASVPMGLARDEELHWHAKAVALYVWSHTADWNQSAADIAKSMKMDRATVGNALRRLQERGWLVREKLPSRPGKTKSAGEIWHLQLSNSPFTQEQIAQWGGPAATRNVGMRPAGSDSNVGMRPTPTCGRDPHPPVDETRTVVVNSSSARSAHYLSSESERGDLGSTVNSRVADAPGERETKKDSESRVGMRVDSKDGCPLESSNEIPMHDIFMDGLDSDPGEPELGTPPWAASEDTAYAEALTRDDPGMPPVTKADPWTSEPKPELVAQPPW